MKLMEVVNQLKDGLVKNIIVCCGMYCWAFHLWQVQRVS